MTSKMQEQIAEWLKNHRGGGILLYDDYNQRVPQDQDVIGTITTNIGNSAPRHGYKIIEIYEQPITEDDRREENPE